VRENDMKDKYKRWDREMGGKREGDNSIKGNQELKKGREE
jgi:hypothetical protein